MNEKRARGEGRIFPRKGSKFLVAPVLSSHGRQIRESAGTDNPEKAAKILRRKIGEVEAGVHRDTRRIMFEDLREAYFDDYRTNGRKSLRFDKQGIPYLDKVTRLNDFFSGFRSSEIDADLIRKFIVAQQAKGLSNGSINRSIAALRQNV